MIIVMKNVFGVHLCLFRPKILGSFLSSGSGFNCIDVMLIEICSTEF